MSLSALNPTPNADRTDEGGVLDIIGTHSSCPQSTTEYKKLDAPENVTSVTTPPAGESSKAPEYRHPILLLPVELLVMVFMHAILPDFASFLAMRRSGKPFTIASTCRHWRNVVLHTRELWSIVDYQIHDLETSGLEQRVATSLRLHIERSSPYPLDVSIDLYDTPHALDGPFCVVIGRSSACPRVCAARDSLTHRLNTSVDVHAALRPLLSQHAPHLARFSFSDGDYHAVGSSLLHLDLDAPRLRILEWDGAPVLLSGRRVYQSVRAVSFNTERDQFESPSFADLLRYFPNVVSADVGWYDERFNLPLNSTRLVEAAHLETLIVKGEDCFFPYNMARRFSFPSLIKANIKYVSTHPDMVVGAERVTTFIRSALRTVRALELDFNAGYNLSFALIDGLESCLRLEHLTLHAYGRDSDAGVDVITALSKTDTPWLCPRLQTLTLHICPLGDFGGALLNLATERAGSRQPVGQGLTQISVYLKEYVDSEDAADKHELSLLRQLLNRILSSPSRLPQWPSPYAPRS